MPIQQKIQISKIEGGSRIFQGIPSRPINNKDIEVITNIFKPTNRSITGLFVDTVFADQFGELAQESKLSVGIHTYRPGAFRHEFDILHVFDKCHVAMSSDKHSLMNARIVFDDPNVLPINIYPGQENINTPYRLFEDIRTALSIPKSVLLQTMLFGKKQYIYSQIAGHELSDIDSARSYTMSLKDGEVHIDRIPEKMKINVFTSQDPLFVLGYDKNIV